MDTNLIKPPEWLDRLAKGYFRQIAPCLFESGVLNAATYQLVGTLCQHYSVYRQTVGILSREGRIIETPNGLKVKHPGCQVEKQAWECYARGFKELGICVAKLAPGADELDNFLEGK